MIRRPRFDVGHVARAALVLAAFGAASASVQGAEERADPPAQVRLRFQDEQGTPIAGVRVRFDGSGWPAYLPERRSAADAQGEIKFQLARPDHVGSLTWDAQAVAELPGYEPATVRLYAFPDARIDKVVTLPRLRTTVIRLRGPQDEPLAHVTLLIGHTVVLDGHSYSHHSYLASNERGDCEWQHGDLPEGFHIDGRPHSERFDDGPVVTVRYAQEDLPPTERLVSGTLVHADGSMAVGWRVARRAWQTGSAGGIPGGTTWNYVGVEDLRRVDAAGQFEARVQKYVIVVSPEGLPFVYELAPQTWLPGTRWLTLRIPPVRSVHAGKVVDAKGKPVAGLPIDVEPMWNGDHWKVKVEQDQHRYQEAEAVTTDANGAWVRRLRTDAHGGYALPLYYGSSLAAQPSDHAWYTAGDDLGKAPRSVLQQWFTGKGQPYKNNRSYKDVTVILEDEHGQAVPSLQCQPVVYLADGKPGDLLGSGRDARGFHVFVEPAAERLELNVRDYLQKWSPFETTIDVAGPDDRVVHVKADASKRWLPLAGRVLNPDGRVVSNSKLRLYAWTDGKRDYHGNDSLRLWATTDDEGRFRFDAAPDRCFIELSHYSSEHAEKIRGWTPPVAVDRTTRDVTIQLQRGGRVKILLPAGIGTDADGLYLDRRDVGDDVPIRHQSLNFDRSPDRRELLSPVLPPGKYHLKNYRSESAEVAAALGEAVLDIEAGQEIVLDLRDRKLPERRPSVRVAKAWQTITVRREGEACSGAEVSVLESVALPEDLTRWIREATAAKTPEAREAAIAMLRNSGALAVDAILAAGKSRQNEKLFEDLGEMRGDGFGPVLTDVSDEVGQVRCELAPRRQCVAVARVRGRFIGWKAFIAGEEAVTVDLQQARTLEVRWIQLLPMEKREKPEHAELRPAQPMDPGLRGLMSTLRYPYGMYFRELTREAIENGQYSLYPDADARWSLEDLPVGFAGELMLSRDFNEVEIPTYHRYRMLVVPGDGVQTMLCPQTEFDWAAFADRLATWWQYLRYW